MNVSFEHDVLVRQPIDYQLQEVGRASDDEESSIRLRPDVGEEYACFAIWEGEEVVRTISSLSSASDSPSWPTS